MCFFFPGDSFIDVSILLQFLNYSRSIFRQLGLNHTSFLMLNHITPNTCVYCSVTVLFNVQELFLWAKNEVFVELGL